MARERKANRVLIIGAGPVGLEAAVLCVKASLAVVVVERGDTVASNVLRWGHRQLFSMNAMNTSPQGLAALDELGRAPPAQRAFPTGRLLHEQYLEPLSRWLQEQPDVFELRLNTTVISIRRDLPPLHQQHEGETDARVRSNAPFAALVASTADDDDEQVLTNFTAVLDCSGTYGHANYMGVGGVPAIGERALRRQALSSVAASASAASAPRSFFFDGLPDPFDLDSASFLPPASQRRVSIAVVGGGYGAAATLCAILDLAASRDHLYEFDVHWLLRRPTSAGSPFDAALEVRADEPGRKYLARRAASFASHASGGGGGGRSTRLATGVAGVPYITVHRGVRIECVEREKSDGRMDGRIVLTGTCEAPAAVENASVLTKPPSLAAEREPFELVVNTLVSQCGYRPDTSLVTELRATSFHEGVEGGAAMGVVPPDNSMGWLERLATPEALFFVLGAKSLGRDGSFSLAMGIQQVGDVVGAIVHSLRTRSDEAEPELESEQREPEPEQAAGDEAEAEHVGQVAGDEAEAEHVGQVSGDEVEEAGAPGGAGHEEEGDQAEIQPGLQPGLQPGRP